MKKAFWVADTYSSCFDDLDCNDARDQCVGLDIGGAATSGSYCTRTCSSDATCERQFGFPGACYSLESATPLCFQTCDFDADCWSRNVCIEVDLGGGTFDLICVPNNGA